MNTAQTLYDFAPLARLMLLGVLVAAPPLLWVGLRNRGASPARRLRALTLLTLFLTFDLILFGAFTRLTDSGLGCPDWPGCYGTASPIGARAEIAAAEAAMPTGPVTPRKAWIEMIHRYLATGVGVLILALAALTWIEWRRHRPRGGASARARAGVVHPGWPLFTLAWVCVQGAFGALTVTMKLFPAIVTMHLIGGLALLALLVRQAALYARSERPHSEKIGIESGISPGKMDLVSYQNDSATTANAIHTPAGPRGAPASAAFPRRLLVATFALLWLQIALGGWVSTNYAVLACDTFPTCQGGWWPTMNFAQGFELWRPLGMTGAGEPVTFAALTAIHYAHRLMAYALLPLLGWAAFALHRAGRAREARWVLLAALWQLVSGLSNVVLGWPLVAAVAHTGGAAALVAILTWALCDVRRAGPVREAATPSGDALKPRWHAAGVAR